MLQNLAVAERAKPRTLKGRWFRSHPRSKAINRIRAQGEALPRHARLRCLGSTVRFFFQGTGTVHAILNRMAKPGPDGETAKSKTPREPIPRSLQVAVFRRDSWLCRWCGMPVIFSPAMRYLEMAMREWGWTEPLAYFHDTWTRYHAP